MNLRDLKYLVAIADHEHFSKAAKQCFVSQPALSMQLKKLEETLGVSLIERTNKSVILTKVGKLITEKARQILAHVEDMKGIAAAERDPFSGQIFLGVFPTLGPYLLPYIVPGLTEAFPKATFFLVEEKTEVINEKLKNGKLDMALLALPHAKDNFASSPLFTEEFVLAVPKNHEFSKHEIVAAHNLMDATLLLLEEGHCMREQTLQFCHHAKALEKNYFRATSLETLRHMVAANAGITLMPKLACRHDDIISYVPFDVPKPTRTIGLVWRNSSSKTVLIEAVIQEIKKLMANHNNKVAVIQ